MKQSLQTLARWLNDPTTQVMVSVFGALIILNGITRAQVTADAAHTRLDDLERQTMRIIRTHT